MIPRVSKALIVTALFALAACGGGGGGDDTGGGGGGGSGGGGAGGSGDGTPVTPPIDDSTALSQTTRAANFEIGSGSTIDQNVMVTLDAGYLTAINGTVRIFGQDVTITNGAGSLNGQDVRVEIDASSVGSFAVPVSVFSYGPDLDSPANPSGETAFVVGEETDASYLTARPDGGSVNYTGGFVVQGVLTIGGNEELSEIEGDITVSVSFGGTDTATTTLTGAYDPASGGPRSVTFSAPGAVISGNGFSGTLNCTTSSCSDGSAIDATFYGPEAEEVGGVLAIDINRGGEVFQGAGTFVIGQ